MLKHKYIFYLLSVVVLIACTKGEQKSGKESSEELRGVHVEMPKKKSELHGWQGLKIKKEGPNLCALVFPENYGLANKEQLMVLRGLANATLDHDLDCVLQVNYAALNQIRFLAVEKQDVDAATMLLNPKSYGGFELDGELAEEYAGEYQLPVLEKNSTLKALLEDKEIAEQLSDSLCSWVEVLGEKEGRSRVKKLVQRLKKENLTQFTDTLSSKCGRVFE